MDFGNLTSDRTKRADCEETAQPPAILLTSPFYLGNKGLYISAKSVENQTCTQLLMGDISYMAVHHTIN